MTKKREPVVRIAYLDWALSHPVKPTVTNVLIYLIRRANKDAECWPEQRTIALALRISTSTARRSIRLLRLCGLVKIVRTARSSQYRGGVRNNYQLQFDVTVTKAEVRHAEQALKGLDQEVTGDRLIPPDQEVKKRRPSGQQETRKIYKEEGCTFTSPVSKREGVGGGENPDFSEQDFQGVVGD